jgi:hypothetical protein
MLPPPPYPVGTMSLASILVFLFALILRSTLAQTFVDRSIQGQRPPVARIDQAWSWSLLPTTFSSAPSANLLYSALNLPPWATFNSSLRSFSGHPPAGSEGSTWITVSANSSDGTSATDGFSLLTVNNPAPLNHDPFSEQLSRAFSLGADYDSTFYVDKSDGSIRVPLGRTFSLSFKPSTFTNPRGSKIYYTAREAGTGQLPDWLAFNNETVTFEGAAPIESEAEGARHEIVVVGSDYFGYGDVQQRFIIAIASHDFRLVQPFPAINATIRSGVNYTVPLDNVRLDNVKVAPSNVTIDVDRSSASFLTYDSHARVISGRFPTPTPNDANILIPVHLRSPYGDSLTDIVALHIIPDIFVSDKLPERAVKCGKLFELDLKVYSAYKNAVISAVISPPQSTSWLSFDADDVKLSGTAPKTVPDYGDATVELSAFDSDTGIKGSSSLTIQYSPADLLGLSHNAKVALAVFISVIYGLALLIGVFAWYHRYLRSTIWYDAESAPGGEDVGKGASVDIEGGKRDEKGRDNEVAEDHDEEPRPHMISVIADGLRGARGTHGADLESQNATMTRTGSLSSSSSGSSIYYSAFEKEFESPVTPDRNETEGKSVERDCGVTMTRDGLRGAYRPNRDQSITPYSTIECSAWAHRTRTSFYPHDIESNSGSPVASSSKTTFVAPGRSVIHHASHLEVPQKPPFAKLREMSATSVSNNRGRIVPRK